MQNVNGAYVYFHDFFAICFAVLDWRTAGFNRFLKHFRKFCYASYFVQNNYAVPVMRTQFRKHILS